MVTVMVLGAIVMVVEVMVTVVTVVAVEVVEGGDDCGGT